MVGFRIVASIVVLLAAMFLAGVLGARQRSAAVLLALLSVLWLLSDSAFEGVVLVDLTSSNGVTTSDLVGVVGLVVAAAQWWRLRPWGPHRIRRSP